MKAMRYVFIPSRPICDKIPFGLNKTGYNNDACILLIRC